LLGALTMISGLLIYTLLRKKVGATAVNPLPAHSSGPE